MRFSPTRSPARWALLLAFVAALSAAGCGNKTATVSGKVKLDGEPLKGGNVTFVRNDGKPTISSVIAEDGTYKMENVPVGVTKICVETKSLNPALTGSKLRGGQQSGPLVNKPDDPNIKLPPGYDPEKSGTGNRVHLYVQIPDSYAEPDKTDLTLDVKPGKQEHEIALKSK